MFKSLPHPGQARFLRYKVCNKEYFCHCEGSLLPVESPG